MQTLRREKHRTLPLQGPRKVAWRSLTVEGLLEGVLSKKALDCGISANSRQTPAGVNNSNCPRALG